jgi:predicted nucleic acid-binding protein
MPTYLFDASALCKRYFINETGANVVETLFQDATSPRYLINLAIPEILNAIYSELAGFPFPLKPPL